MDLLEEEAQLEKENAWEDFELFINVFKFFLLLQ